MFDQRNCSVCGENLQPISSIKSVDCLLRQDLNNLRNSPH